MFIINITYKVDIKMIDKYLEAHIDYLKEEFIKGTFITSGRKNPRDGGIIISNIENKIKLEMILDRDPFKINDLATYNIIEFLPTKVGKGYENLL
ncbi:MAG: YciI family protein [Psychrilyobacter sp.]|uniref:YciI family protein n=1 Tax=Psychrilyobacter sp. TaxID=2586924 RepID=UPI003C78F79A